MFNNFIQFTHNNLRQIFFFFLSHALQVLSFPHLSVYINCVYAYSSNKPIEASIATPVRKIEFPKYIISLILICMDKLLVYRSCTVEKEQSSNKMHHSSLMYFIKILFLYKLLFKITQKGAMNVLMPSLSYNNICAEVRMFLTTSLYLYNII